MGAFAVAAALHVAAFAAVALRTSPVSVKASEPAILVDMVPQEKPQPTPQPTQRAAAPKTVMHSPAVASSAVAPMVASAAPTTAPLPKVALPTQASAPDVGAFRADWAAIVLRRLEQFKRYPAEAVAGHEQGVVYLRFVIDREGLVHSARIDKSSGYDALDHEALVLARRAQPFPRPPSQLAGDRFDLVVPIRFSLDL